MFLKTKIILLLFSLSPFFQNGCKSTGEGNQQANGQVVDKVEEKTETAELTEKGIALLKTGAEQFDLYLDKLHGKSVGLVVNQTSVIEDKHLVDILLEKKVKVQKIFAPEHGFRGTADAGEKLKDGIDGKTGIPLLSLYGKKKKPSEEDFAGLDIIVFDIQDVGARFYTYISTMHYVMESCVEQGLDFIVLDRPNPNGHYVDGPVREDQLKSFVGMHPIPVVHGMTVGELAKMINGEGWLANGVKCNLEVVPCANYTHTTFYELPVKPSPNLPNMRSIYLYPSLCFFEGTTFSIGRGTSKQFQLVGHPKNKTGDFSFTPKSMEGAKYPKHEDKLCKGIDLTKIPVIHLQKQNQLQLSYLVDAYRNFTDQPNFFNDNNFFDKLAGTAQLKKQIVAGKTAEEIRASWEPELGRFKAKRKAYLLY